MHKNERPVTPFPISPGCSVTELVQRMAGTSFQARNIALGVKIWSQMLEGERTILMGLAGAMVPAGMRQIIVHLIENRLIDCLVSTGANLFHDLHESLGRLHWQGDSCTDDRELANSNIYRIYDTLVSAEEFDQTENFVIDFSSSLEKNRAYTTREFFFLLWIVPAQLSLRALTMMGRAMVASEFMVTVAASVVTLRQERASSKVQPLKPPHCGESVVIWMAYWCPLSSLPKILPQSSTCWM